VGVLVQNGYMELTKLVQAVEALARSQRELLTAQVLMNDRMDRVEKTVEATADQLNRLSGHVDVLTNTMDQWIKNHPNGRG
jgi:hypothetical protein